MILTDDLKQEIVLILKRQKTWDGDNMSDKVVLYGQEGWHDTAVIIGNETGLMKLYQAIEAALARGKSEVDVIMPMDGEGYTIKIFLRKDEVLDTLPVPYTYEMAKEDDLSRWETFHKLLGGKE